MQTRSLRLSCMVRDYEIPRTTPVAPACPNWEPVPGRERGPSCCQSRSQACRGRGGLTGADSGWRAMMPSVSSPRLLQIAVNTSSSDAISLQTINSMTFAFVDIFLRRLLFKMLEAIHRICWGQVLLNCIAFATHDVKAIKKSSSLCPFTSCRLWISTGLIWRAAYSLPLCCQ